MNLFIDTNVFLSFYHLTDDDLEELKKLLPLMEHGQVQLWASDHLFAEFHRSREGKIADALKNVPAPSLGAKPPAFLRDYAEYNETAKLLKAAGKVHAELMAKARADIEGRKLGADKITEALFAAANVIEDRRGSLYNQALQRNRLGNPPGKGGNTVGDEYHWELLLHGVAEGEDIHIISDDGDYASPLRRDDLDSFLLDEWSRRKGGKARLYRRLSAFFQVHFPEIKLASEIDKTLLIDRLRKSGSFAETHGIIALLNKYTDFTPPEAEQLMAIAMTNDQVGFILFDDDLWEFYGRVYRSTAERLSPDDRGWFELLLEKEEL